MTTKLKSRQFLQVFEKQDVELLVIGATAPLFVIPTGAKRSGGISYTALQDGEGDASAPQVAPLAFRALLRSA
jgi:hypothetical protein